MARIDDLLEAEKRGILPEGMLADLNEARTRGLIPTDDERVSKERVDTVTDLVPERTGIGRTALDQSLQGATFGFGDEAQAIIGALVAKGFGGDATKDLSFEELFEQGRSLQSRDLARQQEVNPGTAIASQIGGALLTGGAAATTGAGRAIAARTASGGVGARALTGAGVGAASGGAFGAGTAEGDISERVGPALKGAAIGGGLGAAIPVAGAAIGAVSNRATKVLDALDAEGQLTKPIEALRGKLGAAEREVSKAFQTAKRRGQTVFLDKDSAVKPIRDNIKRRFRDEAIFPEGDASSAVRNLNRELDSFADAKGVKAININRLEKWRRKVTTNLRRTTDPNAKAALGEMLGAYDETLTELAKESVIKGDSAAINAWRKAVAQRRELGKLFQTNKKTGQSNIFEKVLSEEELTNEQIINTIFGTSSKTKPVTGQIMKRMIDNAGDQGEAVRQNFRNGLIARSITRATNDQGKIVIGKLSKELDDLLTGNTTVLKTAFSEGEAQIIRDLQKGLASGADKFVFNPLQQLFTLPGLRLVGGQVVDSAIEGARNLRTKGQVADAVSEILEQSVPVLNGQPAFYGGLIGGGAAGTLTNGATKNGTK